MPLSAPAMPQSPPAEAKFQDAAAAGGAAPLPSASQQPHEEGEWGSVDRKGGVSGPWTSKRQFGLHYDVCVDRGAACCGLTASGDVDRSRQRGLDGTGRTTNSPFSLLLLPTYTHREAPFLPRQVPLPLDSDGREHRCVAGGLCRRPSSRHITTYRVK